MLGLQINDIIRALVAAGVELSDGTIKDAQDLASAAYSIGLDQMEEERFLQGRIEFVYVRYDAETDAVIPADDPQPAPVETHQPWQPTNTPPILVALKPSPLDDAVPLEIADDDTPGR